MITELKTGMRIQIGDQEATVKEVGPPEALSIWKGWTREDGALKVLREYHVTRCAFLSFDGADGDLFIMEWRNYWWTPGGMRLNITILKPPLQ